MESARDVRARSTTDTRTTARVWCSDQCRRDAHHARKAARDGVVGMHVIRQTETVSPPTPPVPATERPGAASETFDPRRSAPARRPPPPN